MAYNLNIPSCAVAKPGNTGIPNCVFDPATLVGAILVPKTFRSDPKTDSDFITVLQAAIMSADTSKRAYPIFRFVEFTDNSEEAKTSTTGYGDTKTISDGKYVWTFGHMHGLCLQKNLRTFNRMNMDVLFVDSNGVIMGTMTADKKIKGITVGDFYAAPFKAPDGSNPAKYDVKFSLPKVGELNDNLAFYKADGDVEEMLKGLIDLEIFEIAKSSGKVTVGVRTKCDKTDLYSLYGTQLAQANLWAVANAASPVTLSAVAKNDAAKGWDITYTGTGKFSLTLVGPDALAAANIGGSPENGYEADELIVGS